MPAKSDRLRRHSKLEMNHWPLEQHDDGTDDRIALRADELFREPRPIWPAFAEPARVLPAAAG